MSLPSSMRVYDANGDIIKHWFVNCGWTVTPYSLYTCFSDLKNFTEHYKENPIKFLVEQEYSYIELYGWKFPKSVVVDILKAPNRNAASDIIEQFISNESK